MWGAYFCMGAYKRDVVVDEVLFLCGCLLSRFYGNLSLAEKHLYESNRLQFLICEM